MPQPAKRPATYDDLLKVPDNMVAELIDGELYTSPRPSIPHLNAASVLGARIMTRFHEGGGGEGGWWIFSEPELHLGADVVVPDMAGWRRERLPALPATPAFDVAPDWVCEILSPRTARLDRMYKLPMYAREEVEYAWIVDPRERYLDVLRLVNGVWTLLGTYGDEVARIEPFDALEFPVSTLWLPEAPAA